MIERDLELKYIQAKLEDAQTQLVSLSGLNDDREQLQSKLDAKTAENSSLLKQLNEVKQERDLFRLRHQQYQDEHADVLDSKKKLAAEQTSLQKRMDEAQKKIETQ